VTADTCASYVAGTDAPSRGWIARLRMIPDHCREFSIDLRRAEREFGIDGMTAQALIAVGMPHAHIDDTLHFAAVDLHYIGLRLGCATTYLEAMARWTASLRRSAMSDWTDVKITCMPYAEVGTTVEVLEPSGRRPRTRIGSDRIATSFEATVPGRWPSLGPQLADLLHDIASLDFCWIPESMGVAVNLARSTRLADCASASKLLVEECDKRGIEARTAYGLLLASPYSTPHHWAEIYIGEQWVHADPLLLASLARYAGLDASAWPPTRSPGGILLRFARQQSPIVMAGELPLEATFLTEIHGASHPRFGAPDTPLANCTPKPVEVRASA
jgi:Transglutaminase-like superfamily